MQYRVVTGFLVAACLGMAPGCARADSMRCGSRLVVDGQPMAAVRALCGQPVQVQRSVMVRATTTRVGGRAVSQSHTVGSEVPVQTWTYNRGPDKLMMSIRFVNGKVVAVRTLQEYGY